MSFQEDFKKFERDGFVVLKNIMRKKSCQQLLKKTIIPILHRKNIYLSKINKKQGELIYGPKGGHIISKNNKHFRFSSLFNNKRLNIFMNLMHSRNKNKKKWSFNHLAKDGLGWIHLRYPYYKYDNKIIDNVKVPENSFHLDGLNYNSEINPMQSIILLPFIQNIDKNEGGTAVIPESHKLINDHILRYNYKINKNLDPIINKIVEKKKNSIIDIKGKQGDLLILNPYLIHSSSLNDISSKTRITFNLSTEKITK